MYSIMSLFVSLEIVGAESRAVRQRYGPHFGERDRLKLLMPIVRLFLPYHRVTHYFNLFRFPLGNYDHLNLNLFTLWLAGCH
jgi:hypothetical protein